MELNDTYLLTGNQKPLTLIAGPCVIENFESTLKIANELKLITDELHIPFYFKASFDKANRSSYASYRGPGIKQGLEILDEIKKELNIKIITDIHLPDQAEEVASIVDIIQIPAFLCRQTDVIIEAAKTGKIVNVKKGQFLAPCDVKNIINKITHTGNKKIFITERGTVFGYNNLVVDMTGIMEMITYGYPIIFDATHSIQKPSAQGDYTGGTPEFVPGLAKAAVAQGIAGLFAEVHPNPSQALSDSHCMLKLNELKELLIDLLAIDKLVKNKIKPKKEVCYD